MSGKVFDFRYVFFDIETTACPRIGTAGHGLNGPWATIRSYDIPHIDFATWTGFASYIDAHSPTSRVYSAGGDSYG